MPLGQASVALLLATVGTTNTPPPPF
eukprot:COSAG06_NODE_38792_length_419_cov_3.106250_1_plen_25_part_10